MEIVTLIVKTNTPVNQLVISNLWPTQLLHQNSSLKQRRRRCTNLISPIIPNGKTSMAGSTVTILEMVCSVECAKRVEPLLNQQKEPGPLVA